MATEEIRLAAISLCVDLPIYAKIEDKLEGNKRALRDFLCGEHIQFDSYCIHCKMITPFKSIRASDHSDNWLRATNSKVLEDGIFTLHMHCMRVHFHIYSYIFKQAVDTIFKIGQFPSLEDIAYSDVQRFRSVLEPKYFSELHRAGGLMSHNVGIGAFVYLRRIFERLIFRHHEEFVKENGPIDGFDGFKMDQKIDALEATLPAALVGNKVIYGILSKGIHDLDEDTCKRYYPVVRAAIIAILEEDLQARDKARAADELTKALGAISTEIGTKKATAAKAD